MDNTEKSKRMVHFKMAKMMLKAIGGDVEVPQEVKDMFKKETTEANKKGIWHWTMKACLIDSPTVVDLLEIKFFIEEVLIESLNYLKEKRKARKQLTAVCVAVNPMEVLAEVLGVE